MFDPLLVRNIVVGVMAVAATIRYGTGIYVYRVTEALERPRYTVVAQLTDGVEIRRYEPYLIAETTVDGVGFREPTGAGFNACASYIFGKNRKVATTASGSGSWFSSSSPSPEPTAEKMAMTAPVRVSGEAPPTIVTKQKRRRRRDGGGSSTMTVSASGGGGGADTITMKKTKVSFVIGNKYSLKTAPRPLDDAVTIRQIPAHTLAVRTFSGPPPNDERVLQERSKIEKALVTAGRDVPSPKAETLVYGYHDPFMTPNILRRNEVALVLEGTV